MSKNNNMVKIYSGLDCDFLFLFKEEEILARKCSPKTKISFLDMSKFFYYPAKKLKKGWFVKSIIDTEVIDQKDISNDFARLLGYYIGDGNIQNTYSKNGRIKSSKFRLTYSRQNKKNLTEDLIKIIEKEHPKTKHSIYTYKNSNTNIITFYNTKLAQKIENLCGGPKNKKLTNILMKLPPEKQLEIIYGWFKTDGSGEWLKSSNIFTAEKQLAKQLISLLQRCRVTYSTTRINPLIKTIRNKKYKCKGGFRINFQNPKPKDRLYYRKNEIYSRIRKIEK